MTTKIDADTINIATQLRMATGASITPARPREELQQELVAYPVDLISLRTFDALATNLPGTSATDDLALSGGTHGTNTPEITTGDVKTLTVSRKARFCFRLPAEYDAGESITLRLHGGMETTIADGSATADLSVYKSDREGLVDGADLCATSATSINNTTKADYDFTITSTSLEPGDLLDVLLTLAVTDTATGTAVIATVGAIEFLLPVRG